MESMGGGRTGGREKRGQWEGEERGWARLQEEGEISEEYGEQEGRRGGHEEIESHWRGWRGDATEWEDESEWVSEW